MHKQCGFSLFELLIVVAVILVLAAIGIPSLLRSRVAANEASAVASDRTINTAQVAYQSTYDRYAASISELSIPPSGTPVSSDAAGYIDQTLSSGMKQGYKFSMSGTATTFTVSAVPTSSGFTGIRSFCSDEKVAISFAVTG